MADNKTASRWTIEYAIEYEEAQIEKLYHAQDTLPDVYKESVRAIIELHYFIMDCLKELKEIMENRS